MNNEFFKCECGCTQFISHQPHQYLAEDVSRWGSFGQRVYGIAIALICLNCNRITLPPISMSGKTRLDPNVQAYADLLKWTEEHNKNLSNHIKDHLPAISSIGFMWDPEIKITSGFNDITSATTVAEGEDMAKSDKVSMPSKQEQFDKPVKQKSQEPRNKTKTKVEKPKKVKLQKSKSTISKESTDQ